MRAARGRPARARATITGGVATALVLAACAAPAPQASEPARAFSEIMAEAEAEGQVVDLWMWGGDERGNAYVDDVLAPAAADLGVTLRRVPLADTRDAIRRVLAEHAAGSTAGSVDLVWVNGDNFATAQQAGAWRCGWASELPNAAYLDPADPLVTDDFGVAVQGCESPWHKAQFTLVYDAARVPEPPRSIEDLLTWAQENPGRFTYPAPPDFTGSVFVRQALQALDPQVPVAFSQAAFDAATPTLWDSLREVAPALWREGRTYPRDQVDLDRLFADGQVDFTMTYGPATLTDLVAEGTFPSTTRVLTLEEGTVGNASFLAIPASSPDHAGAMVVADLALSPQQQAAKADPQVWGQFTVLDLSRLPQEDAAAFAALPDSPVVPPFEELSAGALPELSSGWVAPLDEGWRSQVLNP
ncbi:ABC transporter substrate-binding protein [Serinibacter salmoneus]|uniref:Putative spermidine/putrescine transport system substrate-binding protein n=1 Tax=Serinibacter salmoneus TaxID=556530 RepID=A0A2A9CZX7_9MICO|nr:ABC transporter substrate-binding protein [Serinibacter salmoneus]PFG19149.1 putative spermidine/putrescine transport system substrate-binding protein [Serinibacter salmoneus]